MHSEQRPPGAEWRYKEIADQLGIGVNTVSTYVRRIYEKLHVRSRAQAVAKLLNVPPEPPPA